MSYRKYKIIDILVWLVVFLALEFLIVKAATTWFPEEPYSVSLMLPMLLIVMMRWGPLSFIHALVYACAFVLYLGWPGTWQQYLIYISGNLGFMCTYAFLYFFGKQKTASKWYWTGIYVLIGFATMELFRGFATMATSNAGWDVIARYFLTDMLCLAFAFVICLVARLIPGLFVDQKTYLLEMHHETEEMQKIATHGDQILDSSTIEKLKGEQQ